MEVAPEAFISRTASTGSSVTRVEFAHSNGSLRVLEKTTFDMSASESVPGSPSLANPYISR